MTDDYGRQILRSVFSNPKNFDIVLESGIAASYFDEPELRTIFATMLSATGHGRAIDPYEIMTAFPETKKMVIHLISEPTTQDISNAIRLIKLRKWKTDIFQKAREWLSFSSDTESPDDIRNSFATLGSLVESDVSTAMEKCGADTHARSQQEIEDTYLAKRNGQAIGVPTGLPTLDRCLSGGFKACELVTVGALTGKGKTHIGVSLTMNAIRNGRKVCYVTIEMSDTAIMKRMIANESGINSKILTAGTFDDSKLDEQMDAVNRSAAPFMQGLLTIADETNGVLENLELLIRKLARQNKVDLLVIDYIQQFYFDKPLQNRAAELNMITSRIKHLTKKYKFATVMLAQLNREAQKDKERGKAHSSHQFEQSHSMAKDSDIILILDDDSIGGQEFLYLAKNRNGEDGIRLPVNLDRRTSRLTEAK